MDGEVILRIFWPKGITGQILIGVGEEIMEKDRGVWCSCWCHCE